MITKKLLLFESADPIADYMDSKLQKTLAAMLAEANTAIAVKTAELAPLYRERDDILAALDAILPKNKIKALPASGEQASRNAIAHHARNPVYAGLTIKELVIRTLSEHFRNGANSKELLNAFARFYGRGEIMRTSLSPQLSRLKDEGRITLDGKVWHLARDIDELPFDHPDGHNENGEPQGSPDAPDVSASEVS